MVSHSLFWLLLVAVVVAALFFFLIYFLWFISNHAFRFVCKHTQADCQTKWNPYHAFFRWAIDWQYEIPNGGPAQLVRLRRLK